MNNTPPEVIEKWRAEFESLLLASNEYNKQNLQKVDGLYPDWKVDAGWWGFLMARQSVYIELPESRSSNDAARDERERIFEFIKDQGYTVNN